MRKTPGAPARRLVKGFRVTKKVSKNPIIVFKGGRTPINAGFETVANNLRD
jgi:hypothetical protein